MKMFNNHYHPNKKDFKYFYLLCCYCSAQINCKVLEDKKLLVIEVKHNHLHSTAKFEDEV